MNKKNFPFKLGADPEFNIIIQNKRVHAEELLNKMFKNFDRNEMGVKIDKAGILGCDGCSATGEIRPNPSNNPAKIVENLSIMFRTLAENTQLFELSTLSNKAPVGGHIHFEINGELTNSRRKQQILHKQLCSFYMPLLLGEDTINLKIRKKSGYGNITDYRVQQVKENTYTFEFRVPSAEWLTTPKIALSTLAYLGTIYNEIINHPQNMKIAKEILITSNQQAEALHSLSSSNFLFLTEALIKKIKKHIKNFEFYEQYKEEIKFILSPEKVINEKKAAEYNIFKGWNLYKKQKFNKREFLSPKKIIEIGSRINLDDFQSAIHIPYNDDEYVSVFVRDLKHRIIAYNWKLQNNYFIFGLRKGVPGIISINKNKEFLYGKEHIKNKEDMEIINTVFNKMDNRFYMKNDGETIPKNEEEGRKYILIGLPYKQRIAQDTKEFLQLIYELEKSNKHKPEKIDIESMEQMSISNPSIIWMAYNRNEELPISEDAYHERNVQLAIEESRELEITNF